MELKIKYKKKDLFTVYGDKISIAFAVDDKDIEIIKND